MELSTTRETISCGLIGKIESISWNPNFFTTFTSSPLVPALIQINPINTLILYVQDPFQYLHLSYPSGSFPLDFP
jgi:hypothetical protein